VNWSQLLDPPRLIATRLLDLCYPGVCTICQSFCDSPGPLCESCDQSFIELHSASACPKCAAPVAQPGAPCPWCLGKGLYPFANIARLAVYEPPLRELIHAMKYHGRWPLAESLAQRLVAHPPARALLDRADCLIPVPLHFRRHWHRGYNQADVLARRLAAYRRIPVLHPVRRIRDTPTQTDLSQKARHENVKNAFRLKRFRTSSIAGKSLLLIDDVMTTGATLQAVARTLLPAKPASISVLVLSIADPRHRHFTRI
jgi:ComF family protein